VKPLRLGAGSRIDSHGVEKDSLPKIIFEDQNDTTQPSQSIELVDGALHVFNDPEGPNRTDLGTLPGSGGGGGGQVDEIIPGSGVSVDNTDPERPVVSAKGGGAGTVAITFTNAPFEVEAAIADPITVPYDWEIVGWRLRGGPGQSGTATVDWLLLNDQDDIGVSITASLTPTVNGTSNESTTLTGWTTTGTAGQLLQAVLTNVSGFKQVVCELLTVRT
jgi:hypothetical protein